MSGAIFAVVVGLAAQQTLEELLDRGISTPVRAEPQIGLEEIDADEVVMRIEATPAVDADGPRLADEILVAIAPVTREGGES